MESFNHQMTLKSAVKKEVSDAGFAECEHSDDESLQPGSMELEYYNNKRSYADEQDSAALDAAVSPLPPRKRAKTQEEKEQRRIERIMRNRQAAHASREKKRKHLEMLETRCGELESENSGLKQQLQFQESLRLRVQQLEAAMKLAHSSGDLSCLDVASQSSQIPTNYTAPGRTSSSMVGGSPAPSLEDDCASPEALIQVKNEDDFFLPLSPETGSTKRLNEDSFDVMNFSFDADPATAGLIAFSESSSKSRHPAASIDELLGYANVCAAMDGPDADHSPSTTFGVTGDFTLFDDSLDPFNSANLVY